MIYRNKTCPKHGCYSRVCLKKSHVKLRSTLSPKYKPALTSVCVASSDLDSGVMCQGVVQKLSFKMRSVKEGQSIINYKTMSILVNQPLRLLSPSNHQVESQRL